MAKVSKRGGFSDRNKNPYNLEPWRPVVSNAEMILCKCNPE